LHTDQTGLINHLSQPMTFSLLNSFPILKLTFHDSLLVPKAPPWRFELSSVENSIPSEDLVDSSSVGTFPSLSSDFLVACPSINTDSAKRSHEILFLIGT
jgi:hypothetical protein